jgi:hypothetical protein
MANQSIEWDVESLIGKLNIIEKVQIPYAANRALNQWAYAFSKKELPREMRDAFERPVPRTLNSGKYEVKGMEARLYIKDIEDKGQSPKAYLYPVSTQDSRGRKAALDTRFVKFLRGLNANRKIDAKTYAIPNFESPGLRLNEYGNVSPGQYQQIRTGLANTSGVSNGYRYISVAPGARNNLSPGIYRVKGRGNPVNLFNYTTRQPKVKAIFDMKLYVEDSASLELPKLLQKSLRQALGG